MTISWTVSARRLALVAMCAVPLVVIEACDFGDFDGAMENATFRIGGGTSDVGWDETRTVVVGSLFTVSAREGDDEERVAFGDLSSTDESVVAPADPGGEPGREESFVAVAPGWSLIEFRDTYTGRLVDFFEVVVGEPEEAGLVATHDREAPEQFAVLGGSEVVFEATLWNADGESMNHHDSVGIADVDPEVLDAQLDGDEVIVQAVDFGQTELNLYASEKPAFERFVVDVIGESSIGGVDIDATTICEQTFVNLVATALTDDGMPVYGVPITWDIEGGLAHDWDDESAEFRFDRETFGTPPVSVTARAGSMEETITLEYERCSDSRACTMGSASQTAGPPAALVGLLSLAGLLLLRRLRP